MNLRECIDEIKRRKKWQYDKDFAAALPIGVTIVSKMGREWFQHFQYFLRILDLCEEVGFDPRVSVEKAQAGMSAKEFEDKLVALLRLCMNNQKPRPRQQFVTMLKRAYDRVEREKTNPTSAVPGLPADSPPTHRKDSAG